MSLVVLQKGVIAEVQVAAVLTSEEQLHLWKRQALTRLMAVERSTVAALSALREVKQQLKSLGN